MIEETSAADRPLLVAILWSAKESALKALHTGLRLDTRSVAVRPVLQLQSRDENVRAQNPAFTLESAYGLNAWQPLQAVYEGGKIFDGWWQNAGDLMRTMVASPPPAPPIFLETPAHSGLRAS